MKKLFKPILMISFILYSSLLFSQDLVSSTIYSFKIGVNSHLLNNKRDSLWSNDPILLLAGVQFNIITISSSPIKGKDSSINYPVGSLIIRLIPADKKHIKDDADRNKYNNTYAYRNKKFEANQVNSAPDSTLVPNFIITKVDLDSSAEIIKKIVKQHFIDDIEFGTLTQPFKFRFNPGRISNNLSLGGSAAFLRHSRIDSNITIGIIAGLSLTQVPLDSASLTPGFLKGAAVTNESAATPSLSLTFMYKKVSIMFGTGYDILFGGTTMDNNWRYKGKLWFGAGIGITLFSQSTGANTTNTPSTLMSTTAQNIPVKAN